MKERMLPERIRKKRKEKGINQLDLADTLGLSEMTIRRWESGKVSPRIEEIERTAEVLNTSVEYLMGLTDDATPPPSVKQELPINNMKEKENDDLDLGYWGAVVERAERAARSNDNGKKALIAGMLRMATDAITGSEGKQTGGNFIAVQENHQHVGDNYVKGVKND